MPKDLDLVMALGMPEGAEKSKTKKGAGSSYLEGKPPRLRSYLMDAVDPSLSHDERAEALCRAMDEFSADEELDEEEPGEEAPMGNSSVGEGMEDY